MRHGVLVAFPWSPSTSSCNLLPTRSRPGGGRCVDKLRLRLWDDVRSRGTMWCVCAGPNCPPDGAAGTGGGAAPDRRRELAVSRGAGGAGGGSAVQPEAAARAGPVDQRGTGVRT